MMSCVGVPCGLVAVAVAGGLLSAAADGLGQGAVSVTGNEELLRLVRQRLKANLAVLPHGRFRVEFEKRGPLGSTGISLATQIDGVFEWDGLSWRFSGKILDFQLPPGQSDDSAAHHVRNRSVDVLVHQGRLIRHNRSDARVLVLDETSSVHAVRDVNHLPSRWTDQPIRWFERLGRDHGESPAPGVHEITVVAQGREIQVAVTTTGDGMTFRGNVRASLEVGGNIVAYEDEVPEVMRRSGTLEWSKVADGFVLKRKVDRETLLDIGIPTVTTLQISDYDSDYCPQPSRFTLADLNLQPATKVFDQVAGRRYTYGRGVPDHGDESRMKQLGAELRRDGFGSKGK